MFLTWYHTVVGNVALVLQLLVTFCMQDLLKEHVRHIQRMCATALEERSSDGDKGTLADSLQQMLKRQLVLIKTLVLFNQCFKARSTHRLVDFSATI